MCVVKGAVSEKEKRMMLSRLLYSDLHVKINDWEKVKNLLK